MFLSRKVALCLAGGGEIRVVNAMADGGLSKMYQLVQWLSNQKDVDAFLEPVDWKTLGLTDYPLVISIPMDLGTIKGRLESGHYTKHAQVAEDVRLVWNNCKTYNQEGSYLYKIADKLAGKFEEKYSKIKTEEPDGPEDENQPPSLEDKRQFRENMYRITSDQLGEIVQTLEQQCPEAIAKVGNQDEIEINIDKVAPRTFHFLANLIKSSLPDKKASAAKKQKKAAAGGAAPPASTSGSVPGSAPVPTSG
ncbi:hypothetical protein NSK_000673 [Nannochloropsis salina CCMP1776]|uniref:Bromo domain-containing protein n=1 Tax=Nannochloropsis salina CCMP1776 TaxID=1027361 RepID=A0A4D9DBE8_9STRA|nr:hypothetical protein NSK_000673 [Nannochloropsis salina CCMP1776]|eukprot:TFJ88324.1 hypothetical protein NSK_000673 [Nannochloropsis salina CCMP1776]